MLKINIIIKYISCLLRNIEIEGAFISNHHR